MAANHWQLQDTLPSKGVDKTGSLVRVYAANKGDGEAQSIAQGFALGVVETVDNRDWKLTTREIVPVDPVFEHVRLTFVSPQGWTSRRGGKYRDGKPRANGDEEFVLRGNLAGSATWYKGPIQTSNPNGFYANGDDIREWMPPNKGADALAWDGVLSTAAAKQESLTPRGEQVRQPAIFVVWRKWMDKDTAGAKVKTLPTTMAEAMDVVNTYRPGATGQYETGGPKLGHVAPGSDNKLLVIDIQVYEDGDLVCREALLEYRPGGWNAGAKEPYGEP